MQYISALTFGGNGDNNPDIAQKPLEQLQHFTVTRCNQSGEVPGQKQGYM